MSKDKVYCKGCKHVARTVWCMHPDRETKEVSPYELRTINPQINEVNKNNDCMLYEDSEVTQ